MNNRLTLIESWLDTHGMEKWNHEGSSMENGSGRTWPRSGHVLLGKNGSYGDIMRTETQYQGFDIRIFYG